VKTWFQIGLALAMAVFAAHAVVAAEPPLELLAAAVFRGQGGALGQGVAWHAGTPFRQEDKASLPPLSFCGRGPIFAGNL
jgi:hypothetical protein